MPIPRLLLLAALIAPCAISASAQQPAQSAPAKNYFPTPPLFGTPAPAPDWHTQIPAFRPNAATMVQTPLVPTLDDHILSRLRGQMQANRLQLLAQNDNTCYAIRDYQFKQGDPTSDVTILTGVSTCLPRAGIQKKDAASIQRRGPVLIR